MNEIKKLSNNWQLTNTLQDRLMFAEFDKEILMEVFSYNDKFSVNFSKFKGKTFSVKRNLSADEFGSILEFNQEQLEDISDVKKIKESLTKAKYCITAEYVDKNGNLNIHTKEDVNDSTTTLWIVIDTKNELKPILFLTEKETRPLNEYELGLMNEITHILK